MPGRRQGWLVTGTAVDTQMPQSPTLRYGEDGGPGGHPQRSGVQRRSRAVSGLILRGCEYTAVVSNQAESCPDLRLPSEGHGRLLGLEGLLEKAALSFSGAMTEPPSSVSSRLPW